jgi:hypothetical protein
MGWLRSEANQQPIQSILTPAEFECRWGSAKATGTAVGQWTGMGWRFSLECRKNMRVQE